MENCENLRIQVPHDLETFLRGRNGGLFTAGGKMFLTFSENTQKLTPNADQTTGADQTTDIGPDGPDPAVLLHLMIKNFQITTFVRS